MTFDEWWDKEGLSAAQQFALLSKYELAKLVWLSAEVEMLKQAVIKTEKDQLLVEEAIKL